MNNSNKFEFTAKAKKLFLLLIAVGIIAVLIGLFAGGVSGQRFWANFLLESVFFTGIAACAIFFVAVNHISMAGWFVIVKRIPEAMTQFTKFGAILILIIVLGTALGYHHLYHWSDTFITKETVTQQELDAYVSEHGTVHENNHHEEAVPEKHGFNLNTQGVVFTSHEEEQVMNEDGTIQNPYYDKIIAGKSGYLNSTFFIIRAVIFLFGWVFMAYKMRQYSLAEELDNPTEKWYDKIRFWAAFFLVFWAVTSSMMAWDWVMSLDPHWFSTLFGWYTFVSLWVASMSVMLLILIHLKRRGYMPQLNENHLHDMGKYIFAFSIFWTYLWFDQFMLYWYGNIPEETEWFLKMKHEYSPLFFGNLVVNFFFPFLVLMRRDAKRNLIILSIVAAILVFGHWVDYFLMVMSPTVGADWSLGYFEIGMFAAFAGGFLYVVFSALTKASLVAERHPLFNESVHHHI